MAARGTRGGLEGSAARALRETARVTARLERQMAGPVAEAAAVMIRCFRDGGMVFFCGNGGSAADAQHLACEFSGRYLIERPGLPSVSLTTNSSALTAIGNDYGYDQVFSRQLEGIGSPGDVLVAITTSGASKSVRLAVDTAHAMGMTVIGMTGLKGAAFARRCDIALVTPHELTPHVQEGHIAMGHAFCRIVEHELFGKPARGAGAGRSAPKPKPAAKPARSGSARRKPAGSKRASRSRA